MKLTITVDLKSPPTENDQDIIADSVNEAMTTHLDTAVELLVTSTPLSVIYEDEHVLDVEFKIA